MQADAHRTVVDVQGYRHVGGLKYDGVHYIARVTDRPGMTRREKALALGLPPPDKDGDVFDTVVIEYAARDAGCNQRSAAQ